MDNPVKLEILPPAQAELEEIAGQLAETIRRRLG